MFKVFKKKSKPPVTPTFGSGKSKSLFSLSRSVDRRKSASGVALDKDHPVQTLSIHYQQESELNLSLDSVYNSHNSDNAGRGFSTFLGDGITENGYNAKQNGLDQSRSADNLDTVGLVPDSQSRKNLENRNSMSSFLERVPDVHYQHSCLNGFSTFKTAGIESRKKSVQPHEETVSNYEDIPAPEGFADPDKTNDRCLSQLPPELDTISLRSLQSEASVIMPPQGFKDSLTESKKTNLSEDSINDASSNVNSDEASVCSSCSRHDLENMAENGHLKKEHGEDSVQNNTGHPKLPPKPNIDKYKQGYRAPSISDMSRPTEQCAEEMEVAEFGSVILSPGDEMNSSTDKKQLINNDLDSDNTEMISGISAHNHKPTPPPRRNKACPSSKSLFTDNKLGNVEELEATHENVSIKINSLSNSSDETVADLRSSCVTPPDRIGEEDRRAGDVSLMKGPMVSSLREHLKRSSSRAIQQNCNNNKTHPSNGNTVDNSWRVETRNKTDHIQSDDRLCSDVSTKAENMEIEKTSPKLADRCGAINIKGNLNSSRPLRTSSVLSSTPDVEVCSISTNNESEHFIISDSFLNDSASSLCVRDSTDGSDNTNRTPVLISLDEALGDSPNVQISDSFLDNTYTTTVKKGVCSKNDESVIIEEDYVPLPVAKRKTLEGPQEQSWEVSMAKSWEQAKCGSPKSSVVLGLASYSESKASTDSNSVDGEDGYTETPGVYRWELKPIILWDTDDVCQWLESKELGVLQSIFKANELTGVDLLECVFEDLGQKIGNEKYFQKLLHDVKMLREEDSRSQQSKVKKTTVPSETMNMKLPVVSSLDDQKQSLTEDAIRLDTDSLNDNDAYLRLPIFKWSTQDVMAWLESVGMEKFAPAFKAQNITGQDIASVDMELLDSLGISSIQDRELILSRLYELQHPECGVGQVAKIKEIFQQVQSFESDKESEKSTNSKRNIIADDKKSNDDNVSVTSLKVWHDVKGHPMDTTITVTSQMTSHDVIVKVLKENEVKDDPSLFTLTRVTLDINSDKVSTCDLHPEDLPVIIHKSSQNSDTKARLELRSNRTHRVKVIYDADEQITLSKMFDVSSMCTGGELLNIAVSAFCHGDIADYSLQAIDDPATPQFVGPTKLLLLYKCDTYKLTEKREVVEITQKSTSEQLEGINSKLKSRFLLKDHNSDQKAGRSSIVMDIDQSSVTDTDILLDPDLSTLVDDPDLETLATLSDGTDPVSKVTCNHSCVENCSIFEQANVFTFHTVTTSRQEAHDLWRLFSVMEREMKQGQTDLLNKHKMLEEQLVTIRKKSRGILGHEDEVDILQHMLIVTSQQIQLVEQREKLLQAQLLTAQSNLRPDPCTIHHLKEQLAETDSCLLDLKQQQADVYRQMKMARRQLAKMYKMAVDTERFSIYKLIEELSHSPSVLHQVVTLNLDMTSNRCDFILGHDSHDRPIIKHAEENSLLQKGDRIIEVNGMSVTHLNETELYKHLTQTVSNLSLVILRNTVNYELKVQEKIEEAESIREDLSLAMIDLEAMQEENRDIKSKLERADTECTQLRQINSDLKMQIEELQTQIQQQNHEVQAQIEQFKEQLQKKEEEIQSLKNRVSPTASGSLKNALQGPSRTSSILSRLSDNGLVSATNDGAAAEIQPAFEGHNGVRILSYEDFGEVPIWQSLQKAPKSDILQALKDQVLENQQQKAYLDHLLTAVIDNAPNLVQVVDHCIGILDQDALDIKPRSEEFC